MRVSTGLAGFLGILALAIAGCGTYGIHAMGTPIGSPASETVQVKRWPDNSLRTVPRNGELLGRSREARTEVWCDSNGNWGITTRLANNSDRSNTFASAVEFGRMENGDPATFVSFTQCTTYEQRIPMHQTGILIGVGTAQPEIQAHFQQINAARPILIVTDVPK